MATGAEGNEAPDAPLSSATSITQTTRERAQNSIDPSAAVIKGGYASQAEKQALERSYQQQQDCIFDASKAGCKQIAQGINLSQVTKGKAQFDGNYIDYEVTHSSQFGIVVRGDIARMLTENTAIDVEIAVGPKQREMLIKAGWKISKDGMLRVTAHQLKQLMTFDFISGKDSTWVSQETFGATIRIRSDKKWLEYLEASGYISNAESKTLGAKIFVIDSATFLRLMEDPRMLAGTSKAGLSGSIKLRFGANDTVRLTMGAEKSEEKTYVASPSKIRATGGAEWTHKIDDNYSTTLGISAAGGTVSSRASISHQDKIGTF